MTRHFVGDTVTLLGRSLRHIARGPDTIITTAVMPIARSSLTERVEQVTAPAARHARIKADHALGSRRDEVEQVKLYSCAPACGEG
ncbi:hypothetical protein SAMN05444920_106423 [Nonomuraea solani]|uniref:Uncharacterized protein n=1 Tax=Nonomuraea solani TaxID=1144553 RepID=A0A1H6DVB3_9ACTN|nr:hypothetical protein SAMN05444920_106423 [Nonomuraea solani]